MQRGNYLLQFQDNNNKKTLKMKLKTHPKRENYSCNNNNKQNAGKNNFEVVIKLLWNENKKAVII